MQRRLKQQHSSRNVPLFWSWVYRILPSKLSFSIPLIRGLVLVLQLLRQQCVRQALAKEVMTTKSAELDYHRPPFYWDILAVSWTCSTFFFTTAGHPCICVLSTKKHGYHTSFGRDAVSKKVLRAINWIHSTQCEVF